jgi:Trypsin
MKGKRRIKMKKLFIALSIIVVLSLALVGTAFAITNGQPDEGKHPYVGLLVFDSAPGEPAWRCSGSLIAPNVVLTAGHCTDGAVAARFWVYEDMTYDHVPFPLYPYGGAGSGAVEGVAYTNPKYDSAENPYGGGNGLPAFSYRDTGIVVLNEPIPLDEYAALPAAGLVDTLKNKTSIDFVGYGVQYQAQIPGNLLPQPPPYYRWTGPRWRMYAPSQLVSGEFVHSAEYLRLALNPGGSSGGTCFGDSGGPDLLGGTNIVLGVNSYVTNINCGGVGYSARVDVPDVLAWIETFLP